LDHFGLATAVRAHVEAACTKAGLARELVLPEEDMAGMPRDTAIALFRIIQEGLTNTIRHSGARKVRLTLTVDAQSCAFELSDDGCGFTPQAGEKRTSHGITGMQQRARSLGGELQLASTPGAGTTLKVRVPARAR
jgi:signal transduction histidine kinase